MCFIILIIPIALRFLFSHLFACFFKLFIAFFVHLSVFFGISYTVYHIPYMYLFVFLPFFAYFPNVSKGDLQFKKKCNRKLKYNQNVPFFAFKLFLLEFWNRTFKKTQGWICLYRISLYDYSKSIAAQEVKLGTFCVILPALSVTPNLIVSKHRISLWPFLCPWWPCTYK